MKTLFGVILLILLAWSFWTWTLLPKSVQEDRHRLVWTSDNNPARQEQIRLFHEQYPECLLELDPANATIEKVIVQSAAGQGPDLFDVYGPSQLNAYVKAGVAMDITELAKAAGLSADRLWPEFRGTCVLDGRQYGFMTNAGNRLLIFNRDIFARFGVPEPSAPLKWDEFVAMARKLTHGDDAADRIWGSANHHWEAVIWQNGGRIFSPNGTRCTVDSAEAVEAVQWYVDLIRTHRVMPSQTYVRSAATQGGWAGSGYRGMFFAGKAAMMLDGRWMAIVMRQMNKERLALLAQGKKSPAPLRYGFAPVPYQKVRATVVGSRCTAINTSCDRPEEAIKFLKFLSSEAYCQYINDSADAISAVTEFATADRLKNPAYPEEHEFAGIQIEEMSYGHLEEISPFIEPSIARKMIQDHVLVAEDGHMSAEQAMKNAALVVNQRIMRNVGKFASLRRLYEQRASGETARP